VPADEDSLDLLVELTRYRDLTCLVAALDGHPPPPVRERWHASSDLLTQMLPSLEYERCIRKPHLFRMVFATDPLSFWRRYAHDVPWSQWRLMLSEWWQFPEIFTQQIASLDKREADFIGDRQDHSLSKVLSGSIEHRFMMLADDVLAQRGESGALPIAPVLDLAGGPRRLALRYHLIAADRFAIVMDTAAPLAPAMAGLSLAIPDLSQPGSARRLEISAAGIIVDCVGGPVGTKR